MLYVNPLAALSTSRLGPAVNSPERQELALKELEHYFLFTLLREMRRTLDGDRVFGDTAENRVYTEMLDDALSQKLAESGQFGIAKQIGEQLRAASLQGELRADLHARSQEQV